MERVLVTGGAGYIGSTLVPMLLDGGYDVTVFDSLMFGGHALLPCFPRKGFHFIKGDVRDTAALQKVMDPANVVIHLAGIVGYPACKKDPTMAKEVNEIASQQVADLLRPDQLLIFSSTGSNYGAVPDGVCTEETPLRPLTIYGHTKTNAEKYFLAKNPTNSIVFRFATAFGVSPRMRLDLLINDFVHKVLKDNYLLIYEADFKRTFIEVRDIARSFLFALEHRQKMIGHAFNVGSNSLNHSKRDVALFLKQYRDYFLTFIDDGKDEDQRNYEVSYDKISKLGYNTTVSLQEGVDVLVNSMKVIEAPKFYSNV